MQDEYDIKKIMEEIEMQLIASMRRTLWSHKEDEKAKGFDWPQWQAIKIKQFEDYKKANKENMIDEIRKMINVDKIIRFETTQESTGVIIGKNDSNEMVKNLKKIYEPYFWEKQ